MIRLGVLCPANIAINRFLPALLKCRNFLFSGVGISSCLERKEFLTEYITDDDLRIKIDVQYHKALKIVNMYGGRIFTSYQEMVESNQIDAVYIPLPPAMHYRWAKSCLENKKHVFLEKPFTTNLTDTEQLLKMAQNRNLSVLENYMFVFHNQVQIVKNIIETGRLGKIRYYDAKFGFPYRGKNDFRYNKVMGGGALLDCGGYLLKNASQFLGNDYDINYAFSYLDEESDVDLFGAATLLNGKKQLMNIAFGMDCAYQCGFRVWGSEAMLETPRFFTAPPDCEPVINLISSDGQIEKVVVHKDDTFQKSILYFEECIKNNIERKHIYNCIEKQAEYVQEFRKIASLD